MNSKTQSQLDVIIGLRNELKNQVGSVEQSLNAIGKSSKSMASDVSGANQTASNSFSALESEITNLRNRALSELVDGSSEATGTITDLGEKMMLANKVTKELKDSLGTQTKTAQELGKEWGELGFKVFLGAYAFNTIAMQLDKVGQSIKGFISSASTEFKKFEDGNADLRRSLGLTQQQASGMGDAFTGLSLELGQPIERLYQIGNAVSDAGIKSQPEIIALTGLIARMSRVFDDVPVDKLATDILKVAKNYQLTANQVANAGSVILGLSQGLGGSFDSYLSTLTSVSGTADRLNISFEDTASILGALVPLSTDAGAAGEVLSEILSSMASNSEEVANTMGLSVDQFSEKLRTDAVGTVIEYSEALKSNSSITGQAATAAQDFGQRGGAAMLTLANNIDLIKDSQKIVLDQFSTGSKLQEEYTQRQEEFGTVWEELNSTVAVFKQEVMRDLLPILTKGVTILTQVVRGAIQWWSSLSDETKKYILIGGLVLIAASAIATVFAGVFAAISSIIIIIGTLVSALGGVAGAIAVVVAVGGAFIAVLLGIAGALAALFGMDTSGIKKIGQNIKESLNLDGLRESLKGTNDEQDKLFKDLGDSAEKGLGKAGEAVSGFADLLHGWTNTFLGDYVYQFTKADWEVLESVTDIAEQHFKILEKAGVMSAKQATDNMLRVRGMIGDAINEYKTLGEITNSTTAKIEQLVGSSRTASIIQELVQGLKVAELEGGIKKINEDLGALRDALATELKVIDAEIKAVEKLFADQMKPLEEVLVSLEKQKKEMERLFKIQVRAYEFSVRAAEEAYTANKRQFDEVKRINKSEMQILKDEEDLQKEKLDAAKEQLNAIKKLRQAEVDAAEGILDFSKMNLQAAQNALKKEQILGKDEFDASFRAALARVENAEAQVDISYESFILAKRAYKQEIGVAEDKVSVEEAALKDMQKQMATLKRIQEQQERYYEGLVEVAKDRLDSEKEALARFKQNYEDQKTVLTDQIDVQKDMLADMKEQRAQQLSVLKESRAVIQDRYAAEIDVLNEKLKASQATLDKEKEYLFTLQKLNDEYIKTINDRMSSATDQVQNMKTLVPECQLDTKAFDFGEQTLEFNIELPDIKGKVKRFVERIRENFVNSFSNVQLLDPATLSYRMGEIFNKAITGVNWGVATKLIVALLFPFPAMLFLIGQQFDWTLIKNALTEKLKGVSWGDVGTSILQLMFPPLLAYNFIKGALGISSDFEWSEVLSLLIAKVTSIDWGSVVGVIGNAFSSAANGIKDTATGLGDDFLSFFRGSVQDGIPEAVRPLGPGLSATLTTTLSPITSKFTQFGRDMGVNLGNGVSSARDWLKQNVRMLGTSADNEFYFAAGSKAATWGKHMTENIANGITSQQQKVKDAVTAIAKKIKDILGFTVPEEGPLHNMLTWMPHMMQNLATGISGGMPKIEALALQTAGILSDMSVEPLINSSLLGSVNLDSSGLDAGSITSAMGERVQINFNVGTMVASEGEKREFARMMTEYFDTENNR